MTAGSAGLFQEDSGPSEGNWDGGCALAKRVVKVNMGECSILRYLGPCQSRKNSQVGG